MCEFLYGNAHLRTGAQRSQKKSTGSPGARIIGELPGVGTGNQIQSSARALCTPNR